MIKTNKGIESYRV